MITFKSIFSGLHSILWSPSKTLSNDLLSNQCLFCLEPSTDTICPLCTEMLPRLDTQCPRCAEPNYHGEMCGHCIKHPPAFDHVICPFIYSAGVTNLIGSYKRSGHAKGCEYLINALINNTAGYDFDRVIPVPYHWRRLLQRGHNPVRELSIHISRAHNITMSDTLTRKHSSSHQKQLNRQQRLGNLHGAFMVNHDHNKAPLFNQNILLIDDVLTTGATCHSAALTLKQAGAKSVTVACLARTPAHN